MVKLPLSSELSIAWRSSALGGACVGFHRALSEGNKLDRFEERVEVARGSGASSHIFPASGRGTGRRNNKTETSRVIYKTEAAHFSGRGVYSSPRFEYSVRGTAIKSFDKRGWRRAGWCRPRAAMHRQAFSFASEKRMNVAPVDKRRVHVGYTNTRDQSFVRFIRAE